ncbi:[protein-PII] uridylyltransferase [Pikeienuella piscinae]|uniref:Bifunctional uridylyltransferase/uridylyl-removing enzyme n=2 Tax=Pikeienuella piscinae TaxID=2748098 RepID=A0A7M3T707_9RHOB|nr:[protein-PII] uridylyltransferase [Pikeienuella piscinae]
MDAGGAIPGPGDGEAPVVPAARPTRESLAAALEAAAGAEDSRAAAIEALKAALNDGRSAALALLGGARDGGPRTARALCEAIDLVVTGALDFAANALHPNHARGASESFAVVATGGYGRGEMAPFSDVDLLFLTPYKKTPWIEQVIEATLYILWDLKLKVGHATRSVAECLRLSKEDITIRTSLLEKRYLWGDRTLAEKLRITLRKEVFLSTGAEFVEAKLAERDARHAKHGGSRYLVEPNIKEGKGGLRDLQTLFWIAKYVYDVEEVSALIEKGVLKADEAEIFAAAATFLWTVRCHLHLVAGRAQERLTFDFQVEIAARLGFEPQGGKRAVEVFMQRYYRHAKDVGDLTRFFCAALEADQKKARPGLGALIRAFSFGATRSDATGLVIRDGRLDISDESWLDDDRLNILRLFEEGLKTGALIHPNAHRMVARKLHLIDDAFRADPEANAIFLNLLVSSGDPERALRRMNETGVLGAFIPEFDRIVSLMQFNMYHHYTVDEHTILAIGGLHSLAKGELASELPVSTRIVAQGVDMTVLTLALLLHDIGKGSTRPHEEVGAEIAASLCPRLGLTEGQTELVEWLVRHHLIMSDTAQKRDISDPATVRAFADQVRSVERLKLLLVVTSLDIRAVGPNVWNNWKAQLLRALYRDTLGELGVGNERLSRADLVEEAKDLLLVRLTTWKPEEIEAWFARHQPPYWLGLDTDTQERLAEIGRNAKPEHVHSRFDNDPARDATRCCLYLADHPGLFSRVAGALALAGASVRDARVFTASDGMTTAVFWMQDHDGAPFEQSRHERLKKSIHRALRGEFVARDALKPKRGMKRRERPFDVPTTITFDNDSSDLYTVIEVDTRDRVGLLYDLARVLAAAGVNTSSAVITTFGEQVVDSFYVKDIFGLKIRSAAKQKSIEKKLRDAIRRAADEAGDAA